MIRGIYTAATGMMAELSRQDIIANNLANVDVVGFKSDNVSNSTFSEILLNAYNKQGVQSVGKLGLGVQMVTQFADLSNGQIQDTGNIYDLAIQGDGLFSVATPTGTRYTRAGNFVVDSENYLSTKDGFRILGENGPIQLKGKFEVTRNGEIVQNGKVIERLQLIKQSGTVKQGELLYSAKNPETTSDYQIYQGFLERSNVNSIKQMIDMIAVSRSYEMNQRVLTAHDETLSKAVNELTR